MLLIREWFPSPHVARDCLSGGEGIAIGPCGTAPAAHGYGWLTDTHDGGLSTYPPTRHA